MSKVNERAMRLGLPEKVFTSDRILKPEVMLDLLLTNVRRDGECLIWAGAFLRSGYPGVMWAGKRHSARRLLFVLRGAKMGPRDRVIATCGERTCMNPKHLRVVDQGDVIRKAFTDGRMPVGFVRSIREFTRQAATSKMPVTENERVFRMRQQGLSYSRIGAHYGVHRGCVHSAVKRWMRVGIGPWRQGV